MAEKGDKLASAYVELKADVARLEHDLSEAKDKIKNWGESTQKDADKASSGFDGISKSLQKIQGAISRIFIPIAVFNQIEGLVRRVQQLADGARKAREEFGKIAESTRPDFALDMVERFNDITLAQREVARASKEASQSNADALQAQIRDLSLLEDAAGRAARAFGQEWFRTYKDLTVASGEAAKEISRNFSERMQILQSITLKSIDDGNKQLLRTITLQGLDGADAIRKKLEFDLQDLNKTISQTDDEQFRLSLGIRRALITKLAEEQARESERIAREAHERELERIRERAEEHRKRELEAIRDIMQAQQQQSQQVISSLELAVSEFSRSVYTLSRNTRQVIP